MFDYDSTEAMKAEILNEGHRDKVRNRIRVHYPDSLCMHCNHAFIYRTPRDNDPTVLCVHLTPERQMPLDVVECSRYSQIGQLDISTLAKMATLIETKETHTPGFHIPTIGDNK